ncbi:GTP 3',8-cyclase MoaA [Pseudomonas chlororaphis]|uniref:GTP 3',8-cyclase MoaA n=1 Tax=Pseudomonas chlororaphis TaxID=587753 RepID=UPI00209B6210|nr:GTP 3',8-cyclase MoaA [Pseudomonas chlororaphis]MCO7570829.1 GTP 3',8-cyclase MoaA [Pseudomonas chlororaphis]MCO7588651.1 GTP 3',8-cyclase MoaA [Pseudomonas chlororaphis]
MSAAILLRDGFGRQINYLRLSVTDRCNFRCVYCMPEKMRFLPRAQVLSAEELLCVGSAFVDLGVNKIRLTGGEPLVNPRLPWLVEKFAALPGLDQVTLTTNGDRLGIYAKSLKAAGLDRINISLDSLKPERFAELTRTGSLRRVLEGIAAAQRAGFKRLKINAVILRGRNDDEVLELLRFARHEALDITFIEEMPLGHINEHDRKFCFISSEEIKAAISTEFPLIPTLENSGGPARYYRMDDSPISVGFISPHSNNFCGTCNRVRVTAEGRLLLCLGNEHSLDLRQILRESPNAPDLLKSKIQNAMSFKPESHHFDLNEAPQIVRFMNMTGG